MARVRKVTVGDREVDGVELGFQVRKNDAVELVLDDHAVLRLRPVVVNVTRTNERTEDGDRLYVIQQFVYVSVAEPGVDELPAETQE